MNIKDFENEFEKIILQRGHAYYKDGAVLSIERSEYDGEYSAEVEGSEIYNVSVDMDDSGQIDHVDCDCPYEYGYCKHIAAVLYYLRDMNQKDTKPVMNKESLSSLIGKCSREQLVKIILDHSEEDHSFRDYLKMLLSECGDINKYISDFKRIAKQYFSENCDIDKMFKAADILIQKAENQNEPTEIIKACTSIISIFEEQSEESYIYDEESWEFNSELDICSDKIKNAVKAVIESENKELIAEIWPTIINAWTGDDDYSGDDRIFPALMQFAAIPEYRQKLEEKLICMRNNSSEYEIGSIDKKRFRIIESYGSEAEADKFIYDHIDDADFRSMAIDNAISAKDYAKAEQLALEGEATYSNCWGLVDGWMRKRHDIYVLNGDRQKLEDICRRLILRGGSEFYNEWKACFSESDIHNKIAELLNTNPNHSYEYIVVLENMTDKIYSLCCDRPDKITEYFLKLKGTEFEEKGIALYEKYLRSYIENSSKRSAYQSFCWKLKKFAKDCGRRKAQTLADDLRSEYYRRPAFLDELNNAGF